MIDLVNNKEANKEAVSMVNVQFAIEMTIVSRDLQRRFYMDKVIA